MNPVDIVIFVESMFRLPLTSVLVLSQISYRSHISIPRGNPLVWVHPIMRAVRSNPRPHGTQQAEGAGMASLMEFPPVAPVGVGHLSAESVPDFNVSKSNTSLPHRSLPFQTIPDPDRPLVSSQQCDVGVIPALSRSVDVHVDEGSQISRDRPTARHFLILVDQNIASAEAVPQLYRPSYKSSDSSMPSAHFQLTAPPSHLTLAWRLSPLVNPSATSNSSLG